MEAEWDSRQICGFLSGCDPMGRRLTALRRNGRIQTPRKWYLAFTSTEDQTNSKAASFRHRGGSMATAVAPRIFRNFINGEWVESRSGKAYENRNPANTDELVGMFASSTAEDADAAVEAAKEAYKSWRLVPAPKRAEILFRAAELLVQRKEQFSKDMT